MKEVEFNLLDEPWVRVLCVDCTVREVSLTEALLHAHEYKGLAGELPTQDVAVLRLLLAVLYTVFSRVDVQGENAPISAGMEPDLALNRWESLWQLKHFPVQPITTYLEKWHERFWLFHPERPFWQVPQAKIGTAYSAAKLNGEISESGNKLRMFTAYSGTGKSELSYAQAARWLLYVNGFDDTSAKPKGKGLPSTGAGWLGKLGLILAQGNTLFETLMLNLVLLKDGEQPWQPPLPCWELPEARSAERTEIPQPDDLAALLTLQSRRLLLHQEGGKVIGYTLLGGDFFERENAFCEQMTVWRAVPAPKNGPVSYLPKRHDPAKQFWREFPSAFLQESGGRRPGVVRWVEELTRSNDAILDRKTLIRFQITGVGYGDKDFFVTDTFSDSLTFHAALLDELGRRWRQKIADEIDRCEKLADAVGNLARNLDIAASDPDHASKKNSAKAAQEQFYFRLDQPFRRWLCDIDPAWDGETAEEYVRQWRADAKRISQTLGRQLVDQSGSAAFVGRMVKSSSSKADDKETYYSAPKVYNWFLADVNRVYQK